MRSGRKAIGEVSSVAAGIGDIRRLFSNAKIRDGWAETQVRALLEDILPPDTWLANHPDAWLANHTVRPDSGEMVEFTIIIPTRCMPRSPALLA